MSRLPFAIRLALRDLGRYQARAGAAVAAISLGLAISVAIVGIASASEPKESDANLSDRQVLVRTGAVDPGVPLLSASDAARLDAAAQELAADLDHATVLPLDFAVDVSTDGRAGPQGNGGYGPVTLGRPVGSHTIRDVGLLYVATPALANRLGVDLSSIGSNIDLVTPRSGPLFVANTRAAPTRSRPARSITSRPSRTRPRRRTCSRRPASSASDSERPAAAG